MPVTLQTTWQPGCASRPEPLKTCQAADLWRVPQQLVRATKRRAHTFSNPERQVHLRPRQVSALAAQLRDLLGCQLIAQLHKQEDVTAFDCVFKLEDVIQGPREYLSH